MNCPTCQARPTHNIPDKELQGIFDAGKYGTVNYELLPGGGFLFRCYKSVEEERAGEAAWRAR